MSGLPPHFQTATLGGMARRELRVLLVTVARGNAYSFVRVGPGIPPPADCRPVGRGRWGDVAAGDEVEYRDGSRSRVAWVVVEECDPASECGRVVESGRAWLAGE